ncbi:BQ5605_C002g01049 [Microbotryum silenes-dioicae]|uniref:BQ5605_C002g01049 protein n=1 Tax=Microbotryum silenes-dioicae TaxID=796604 RepID=A0A2X0P121_9BASI|nr:BQ5605_C002g01049 [Microbotryum silenes-dioicae]
MHSATQAYAKKPNYLPRFLLSDEKDKESKKFTESTQVRVIHLERGHDGTAAPALQPCDHTFGRRRRVTLAAPKPLAPSREKSSSSILLHGKVLSKHDTKTRTFTSTKSASSYLPIDEEVDEEQVSLILGRIKTKFPKRRRNNSGPRVSMLVRKCTKRFEATRYCLLAKFGT